MSDKHLKRLGMAAAAVSLALGISAAKAGAATFTFNIDPAATFGRTNGDSFAKEAVPIDLGALGIRGDSEILLERLGDFSVSLPSLQRHPDIKETMIGVFSSSDELLPSNLLLRVPGVIDAGDDVVTLPTIKSKLATDIPEDFWISDRNGFNGVTIKVPTGATHLFVAAYDNFYGDNGDPDRDYAVRIATIEKVPEPTSALGLLALGVLGVGSKLLLKNS